MEQKLVKKLNWYYYGIMVFSLIVLTAMYFLRSKGYFTPIDYKSQTGQTIQYFVIFDMLITIPLGLYLIKWRKPKEMEDYARLAKLRILLVGNSMPLGIAAHYYMGTPQYTSMLWIAAIAAIAWYFTKPTVGKIQKEMTPDDPNEEKY